MDNFDSVMMQNKESDEIVRRLSELLELPAPIQDDKHVTLILRILDRMAHNACRGKY